MTSGCRPLPAQAGIEYTPSGLLVFEGAVQSGCGDATAATGPFSCGAADRSSSFDVSFCHRLDQLGGTTAPIAQMYIVAHEFARHIQLLADTLGHIGCSYPGTDSRAVGDDSIPRPSGGEVQPDLWTHGPTEQPSGAFLRGDEEGTLAACTRPGRKSCA